MLRKVFLVEDETVIREGLRDRIPWDQFGYRFVGEAADGEMALPLIRKTKPDVLITDIKMPFMDGLSLSKIVSKEFPRMKIIIISGYDDFAYAVEMLRNGVREYILKPIEREKITEILKKLNAEKNVTFLISSHMAGEIEKTCNKVAVIYESELIATSTTEDALRLHPSMEDYFLSVVKDRRGEIII